MFNSGFTRLQLLGIFALGFVPTMLWVLYALYGGGK